MIWSTVARGNASVCLYSGRFMNGGLFEGVIRSLTLETLTFASWNQIGAWLNRLDALRRAA
jgi:hypothetical protein